MNTGVKTQGSKSRVGVIAVLTAGALNFKVVGGMLLKSGWLLKSGLTMFLSLGAYGFVYGWRFAVALVGLLIVHEFGHWVWLKANGIAADVPVFIPFVGAVICLKKLPERATITAWTALAGPLIGGAGALICWGAGFYWNCGALMAGGSFGFMLNLFQLVPAMPLDGGWVLASISKVLLIPGTIILVLLAILSHSFLLVLISIIAVASLFSRKKAPQASLPAPALPVQTVLEYERQLVGTDAGQPEAQEMQENQEEKKNQERIANDFEKAIGVGQKRRPLLDLERCAILTAYVLLTGLLGFMSVESIAVMNSRLHIKDPMSYLRGKEQGTNHKAQTSD